MKILLRVLAVLIGLRGLVNVVKPLGAGSGMVFFGALLPIQSLWGPVIGVLMLAFAAGAFLRRPWGVIVGVIYSIFATLNLILFPIVTGLENNLSPIQYAIFAVGGIAIPWGAVILLRRELATQR